MLSTITVVTTANKHRTYVQRDQQAFDKLCASLQRYQQFFKRRSLILSSGQETEIFLPASLTRIEIRSEEDVGRYLLGSQEDAMIRAFDPDQTEPETNIAADSFSGRVDFFFHGGDSLSTWVEGPLAGTQIERVANFNNVFDQGVIAYVPLTGGIGFMNPEVMTRVLVHAGAQHLPVDAWRVDLA
jgi:hypothetical protein